MLSMWKKITFQTNRLSTMFKIIITIVTNTFIKHFCCKVFKINIQLKFVCIRYISIVILKEFFYNCCKL